jgi:hypothetical protein
MNKDKIIENLKQNCFFGPICRFLTSELTGNEFVVFSLLNSFSPSYPSYAEIYRKSKIKSPDTLNRLLQNLKTKKFINYESGNFVNKESNLYEINNDFIALCVLEFIKNNEVNDNIVQILATKIVAINNSLATKIVATSLRKSKRARYDNRSTNKPTKLTNKTNQQGLVGFFKEIKEEDKEKIYGLRQLSQKTINCEANAYATLLNQGHTHDDLILMAIDLRENGSYSGDKCNNPFSYLLKSDCNYYLKRAKGLLFKMDQIEKWVNKEINFDELTNLDQEWIRQNGKDSFRYYSKETRGKLYKKGEQQ